MTLPHAIVALAIAIVASAVIISLDNKSDYELCVDLRLKANKMSGVLEAHNAIKNAVYVCTESFYPIESYG